MMKTQSAKTGEVKHRWYVVDASDKVLGRTASQIAHVLRGKHKVQFTPHTDTGDFVVVINADKIRLTGSKEEKKMYHHHTGWIGHLVSESAEEVRGRKPEMLLQEAVWGMLPKGVLGRQMYSKLKVYAGAEHPHAAQKPEPLALV
jgi:large subunit ribosomal protein L13